MTNTVLVLGASGLIGTATVDAFLEEDSWEVVAVSRRRPEVSSDRSFRHVSVDLADREASAAAFRELPQVSHVVYAASFEKPGLVAGWSDAEQMQTNLAMLRNVIEPLSACARFEHVSIMQGTKAYGVHLHPIPIPARERQPRDNHPNFYWLQEDYLKEVAARIGFGWTIFRPVHVVGPAFGVAYSTPPVIGALAAICREESLAFGFPGGSVAAVKQVADVRLVARAIRWAARARQAWGEHFNLTNGEVFSWLEIWPSLATTMGLPIAEPRALSMAEFLPSKAATWERIVQKYALRPLSIDQLLGQSHFYADYTFGYGLTDAPPPALVSTIKVKQAGFTDTYDTEVTFRDALRVLSARKVLPPMG
jgi:nucleoside-diphosphate-sugar epimerase